MVAYSKQVYNITCKNKRTGEERDLGPFIGLKNAYHAFNYFALCSAIVTDRNDEEYIVEPKFPDDVEERIRPRLKEEKFYNEKPET